MADDYSINAKITADNSGFKKSVEEASKSIGNFGKTLSTFKTAVAGAFVVKGIHEFTKAMNECAKLYVVQAKAEKTLEVASKNNPYLNGDSVKALKSYASELQNISEIGDEQLLPMMAQLAAAGRDQNEIQNIMKAAVDISASGMMSLESAVKSLSGSYAGQIGQLGKLLPQLKNLTTEELENGKAVEIAGKAYEGIAQSTANSSKQLQNSIGDLKEQLGYGWETAFSPMRKGLKDIIDRWTEALKKANDAKKAMTNLDTVVTSGGSAGNVKDAKGTQKDINDRLQKEYRELSRLAELSAKKLKERTKAEKAEYADLIIAYDSYLAKYKLMADTEVEAVRMAQEDKKKEWQKGLNDFQLIIAKEKELEEEQARIDAENATQEKINARKALTDAYDETIAKAREEIEIHRQMGEEITKEEESAKMLEVMKQAYVKMIQESNGELKIEKTRLNDIIKLEEELKKALKGVTGATEELQNTTKESFSVIEGDWNDFEQAVINIYAEIEEESSSWTDFFVDTFHTFKDVGKQAIETIGQSLVEGENAWQNMGAVALESIAQILEALAKELAALAVVNASHYNYGQAAAAAAGATAALVGAGALKGMASQMKKVSKDTQTLVDALKDLKNEVKSIQQAGSSGKISDIASAYAQSVGAIKEAQDALSQSVTKDTWDVYLQSMNSYSESISGLDTSLEGISESLDLQIYAFREIYSATDKVSKNILKNKVLSDLKSQLVSAYSDIENIGKNIGELIINGVTEGVTTSNFLTDVKKYIVNAMTKIAVFTESFQKQLADATSGMLVGITTGDDSIIENSTKVIKNLYETALSTASAIESSISNIFSNINTKTNTTVKSLKEKIEDIKKTGFTDVSQTLKSRTSLSENINKAKREKQKAEQNYYSENLRLTEEKRQRLQNEINSLKVQLDEGWDGFFANSLPYQLQDAQRELERFKESFSYWTTYWGVSFEDYMEGIGKQTGEYEKYQTLLYKINSINSQIESTRAKIPQLEKEYANANEISTDAQRKFEEASSVYQDYVDQLDLSMVTLSDNLKTQNNELDSQIVLYKELYTLSNTYFKTTVLESSLNKIKSAFYSFFEDLQDMGLTVGENLVNAIADGMSQADFLTSMKDYIRKAIIQTVVYTETLQHEIAQIGATISKGIAEGFTDTGLHEIKRDLSYIFYMAQNSISKIDTVLDNVFSGYATGTQNATRGLHLVGEAGPELVRFRGGEQVLNANNTQKALSGAGTTINQNVTFNNLNDTSAYAMMQQFKRYNREMAINGIF